MREYRARLMGEVVDFVIYVYDHNEYDAKEQIRERCPGFTIMEFVEVMPCTTP